MGEDTSLESKQNRDYELQFILPEAVDMSVKRERLPAAQRWASVET